MGEHKNKQVFYDRKRRRWRYSKGTILSVVLFFAVIFCISTLSILNSPKLPTLALGTPASTDRGAPNVPKSKDNSNDSVPINYNYRTSLKDLKYPKENNTTSLNENQKQKIYGFYVNWDDDSFISLKNNLEKMDELIPEWLHLAGSDGSIRIDDQSQQDKTLEYIKENRASLPISVLINNFNPDLQDWDTKALSEMLGNPEARSKNIQNILDFALNNKFYGISIDFEGISDAQQADLVLFMKELYEKSRLLGLEISQCVPLDDDSYSLKTLSLYSDFLILMAYDENSIYDTSAGPVASQSWYDAALIRDFSLVAPEKFVVALGGYGYDWNDSTTSGQEVTFQDVMNIAGKYKANLTLDSQLLNPHFNYFDEDKNPHELWFLDGITVFNEIQAGNSLNSPGKPLGYALWRLGSEDPSVWDVFENRGNLNENVMAKLRNLNSGYDLNYEGQGEILKITSVPQNGAREISYDNQKKIITSEKLTKIPYPYIIKRWGASDPKKIALTFDDGPDREYTPKILNILRKYNVPATFFIIGMNASLNMDILKREAQEGNEIGNHTYTHPNITKISNKQFALELDGTERLLEGILGRKSLLFRPPYAEDTEPESIDQIVPLAHAADLGYYVVGMHIDPNDWSIPGTDKIINSVIEQAKAGKGNVVLLHDGGGNRSQTVEALPKIIEGLRANNFELVTVSNLTGLNYDNLMPPIGKNEQNVARANFITFSTLSWSKSLFYLMFIISVYLGVARLIIISLLALIQKIYSWIVFRKYDNNFNPSVSVVIPAYNEEKVITKTVNSILRSNYENYEIIVVDDGSTDGTYERIKKTYKENNRVKIFSKSNEGKAKALNYGIRISESEIIVTLDADTIFKTNTISKLARKFSDKNVAAVAGNAKVGNRVNMLTRWQALEYITSQNLDRRAFDLLNCIIVVPGSVGAWRRPSVLEAGGFSDDTLAEDTDLTLSILEKGHRVVYEEEAIGLTEAPDSIKNFVKQRFRWMFGTLQSVWKHKRVIARKKYGTLGFLAIPNIIIFQFLLPLIAPFIDLITVTSIFWIMIQKYYSHVDYTTSYLFHKLIIYYVFFMLIDLAASVIPFIFEKKEKMSLLFWLPFQRFLYRQLIYYVAVKSFLVAIKGRMVNWGKFERKATVAENS